VKKDFWVLLKGMLSVLCTSYEWVLMPLAVRILFSVAFSHCLGDLSPRTLWVFCCLALLREIKPKHLLKMTVFE